MSLAKDEKGIWVLDVDDADRDRAHPSYLEALPRYANYLDTVFERARDLCEFEFLLTLLRVRGFQVPGHDPFLTTMRGIPAMIKVMQGVDDLEPLRHLQLWIYGHIVEASEPYEILANLMDIIRGGRYNVERFNYRTSPGTKIQKLKKLANEIGESDSVIPLQEIWDPNLRNAVFHSDYALDGYRVRTLRPEERAYDGDHVDELVNRAIARHEVLGGLWQTHIHSYTDPRTIELHPGASEDPDERAIVIVREGYGATGLKSAWSRDEIKAGKIPSRIGRFAPEEMRMLDEDPELVRLPARRPSKETDD